MTNYDPKQPGGYFIPLPRESPAGRQHLHTTTAGAVLPFLQATITGLILGAATIALAFILRARDPWRWGGGVGLLSWALTWLQLQRHWFNLTKFENLTGLDLNHDGTIGDRAKHEPPVIRVRLSEVTKAGHFHESIFDLPGTPGQLAELAQGLTRGRPFSEREWTGAGRPFSINEFRALRSELIRRGCLTLASQKDSRQGYSLTRAGVAVMRGVLEDSPTPAPEVL